MTRTKQTRRQSKINKQPLKINLSEKKHVFNKCSRCKTQDSSNHIEENPLLENRIGSHYFCTLCIEERLKVIKQNEPFDEQDVTKGLRNFENCCATGEWINTHFYTSSIRPFERLIQDKNIRKVRRYINLPQKKNKYHNLFIVSDIIKIFGRKTIGNNNKRVIGCKRMVKKVFIRKDILVEQKDYYNKLYNK